MTATVMHQLTSFSTISPVEISSDPGTGKHKRRNDEVLYQESPSTFSQVSSDTCNSRIESRSLINDYDSSSSVSEIKSGNGGKKSKITNKESEPTEISDTTKWSSSGIPIVRKSRVSTYLTGTESAVSEHGSRDKYSVASKIADLRTKLISSESTELVQSKRAFLDRSRFSGNNSKTSCQQEKGDNQKHAGNKQTSLADLESRLQKYDFSKTIQSCNSESVDDMERTGTNANQSQTATSSMRHSKNAVNYNVSEMKLKLRGSMESEFLCNELRNNNSPTLKKSNIDTKETYRSIDEILKDYGISNDASSSLCPNAAYKNLSQNNETSQASDVSHSGKNESTTTSRPREDLSQSMVPSSTTVRSAARKESRINSSMRLENRHATTSMATYKINLSQNNETKYGPAHQDLLRKYGSSVDYSSIAAGGKYSGSKHYGRYDYGKSTFTGDVASAGQPGYTSTKVQDFEVQKSNLLTRQLEGSQVDILKPGSLAARNDEEYNAIRQTGSSIDAVEFTISSERQRLRRLNNMITSTSVTTTDAAAHKNLMTRYLSPQRDYDTLRASNAIGKVYSSPTFPSSHYGTSLTPKGSWAGSIGQHDSSVFLDKAASVPSSWNNGFQSYTNYSTSFSTRSPYLPRYSSRQLNHQYNNSTSRSFSLERLAGQIGFSRNHARSFHAMKPESPVRKTGKQSLSTPTQHKNYNQSRCPLQYTSNLSMFSTKSDASCTTTSTATTTTSKKSVSTQKTASRNNNDSKSTSEVYSSSSGHLKYLSKPWQGNQSTKTSGGRCGHRQNVACSSSCSSHSHSHPQKVQTFHNLAKELFKSDTSQASTKSGKPRRTGNRKGNNNSSGSPRQFYGYEPKSPVVPSYRYEPKSPVVPSYRYEPKSSALPSYGYEPKSSALPSYRYEPKSSALPSYGYEPNSTVAPSRKSSGHYSVHSSRTSHDANRRILRSVEKKKARMTSEILIQKTAALPRSSHLRHRHTPSEVADSYRPHSTMATSSRSYPQFSTRLPYQVYRDFQL